MLCPWGAGQSINIRLNEWVCVRWICWRTQLCSLCFKEKRAESEVGGGCGSVFKLSDMIPSAQFGWFPSWGSISPACLLQTRHGHFQGHKWLKQFVLIQAVWELASPAARMPWTTAWEPWFSPRLRMEDAICWSTGSSFGLFLSLIRPVGLKI